jgi:hypothetical protein
MTPREFLALQAPEAFDLSEYVPVLGDVSLYFVHNTGSGLMIVRHADGEPTHKILADGSLEPWVRPPTEEGPVVAAGAMDAPLGELRLGVTVT